MKTSRSLLNCCSNAYALPGSKALPKQRVPSSANRQYVRRTFARRRRIWWAKVSMAADDEPH